MKTIKRKHFFFLLMLCITVLGSYKLSHAQNQDFKKSWADLKKSLKPDRVFIYPISDTSDPDLQAFAFAISGITGVNKVTLIPDGIATLVSIDTKMSMVTLLTKWPKEMENRYELGERTDKGFVLKDRLNPQPINSQQATSNKGTGNSSPSYAYKPAEQDVEKRKNVRQQQDHSEQMRTNNAKLNKGQLAYNNPKNYNEKAATAFGMEYVSYKINGKQFTMYESEGVINTIASKRNSEQEYKMMQIATNKQFFIKFTNPAAYPNIRKFEMNKPPLKTTYVNANGNAEERILAFNLELRMPALGAELSYSGIGGTLSQHTNRNNIVSGSFEVLYFVPGERGIIDAKFNLVLKGGADSKGKPQPDLVITDGRFRARMK